ncbi:MAG TPA: CAP domain-containing protein [Kofleriaceae bacterium]|nr:CAP domain-containing protein [Kofleriaceae bacterium]
MATLLVLGACSGKGPQFVGEQPSWRGGAARTSQVVGPVTFAPVSEPAIRYNEPPKAAPHTALGDAVIAAVRDVATRAGLHVPVADARLFRACAELAEVVPEEGVVGYKLVEFALQRNGIIEPSPHLLVIWGDIGSPELIVQQLQPRLAEILGDGAAARLGVGAAKRNADGAGAVVFALQGSGVSTLPIPRAVAAGGTVVIDAVVDPRYHDPEVFVTYADGAMQRLELQMGRSRGFTSQVTCGAHRGRQQIEITASDAAGSTVLANFPVWCATQPPQAVAIDTAHDDPPAATPEQAEHRLLADLNRDRTAAGLPALSRDDRLAAVARSHSEEMHRTHVVAHISPTTGSAGDRVRAAKIKTSVVLENVARAYGVNEAHDGLMNSPGHRANIMSSVATQIGIGVVFGEEVSGRREMFITQVFTRVPPEIDPPKAVETVRQKLVAVRPTLLYTTRLSQLAQQLADKLAAGEPSDRAYRTIKHPIDDLGRTYQRIGTVITTTADLDTFDGAGLVGDSTAEDVGIGIAQGPHPEIGENAIWVVILLATQRLP